MEFSTDLAKELRVDPQDRLTDEAFWDGAWAGFELPVYFDKTDRSLTHYHEHFVRNFPKSATPGERRLLEVGCGASRWLPYFAREFGHEIWGLDSSELGLRAARENLRLLGLQGRVVEGDLFESTEIPEGYFDVVISLGLIEHFGNPAEPLARIARFAKPGGVVFTQIPNVPGAFGFLTKRVNPVAYDAHWSITVDEFVRAHREVGLDPLDVPGHFGVINVRMVPYPISTWPGLARKGFLTTVDVADRMAFGVLRRIGNRRIRGFFAPSIAGSFRKGGGAP